MQLRLGDGLFQIKATSSSFMAASLAIPALVFALSFSANALAQDQYPPPPPQAPPGAYPEYPPAYPEPVAPPGAVWVGAPGECLYGNGAVYWCAPGVVFSGFPVGWDFARFPVTVFAPGIVVDPLWFDGWRRGHPGFAFRGRIATEGERRAFAEHREEFIRNGARHPGPRYGRPDEHHDDHH
jgi:hypothetical protein